MPCPVAREDISAYVDGELAGPARRALEAHLRHCEQCDELERSFRLTSRMLRSVEPETPARSLVWERLGEEEPVALQPLRCTCVLPQASALLDGELGSEEAASVRAHLYACPQCYRAFRRMEDVVDTLQEQSPLPSPAGMTARIMAGLEAVDRPTLRDRIRIWREAVARPRVWRFAGGWAAAAAATVLVAFGLPRLQLWLQAGPGAGPMALISLSAQPLSGPSATSAEQAPGAAHRPAVRTAAGGAASPRTATSGRGGTTSPTPGEPRSGPAETTSPAPQSSETGRPSAPPAPAIAEGASPPLPLSPGPDGVDVTPGASPPVLAGLPPTPGTVAPGTTRRPQPTTTTAPARSVAEKPAEESGGEPAGPATSGVPARAFASRPHPPKTTYVPTRGGDQLPTAEHAASNPRAQRMRDDLLRDATRAGRSPLHEP